MKIEMISKLKISLYTGLVPGIFFSLPAQAQMAIVNSRDGYANVRSAPSPEAKIITPLPNNTAVLIDEIYADGLPDARWRKVYFGEDPYCTDCEPGLSKHVAGFIHQSQLKRIEELKTADTIIFYMKYTTASFNPSGKKIIYTDSSSSFIQSVNGQPYFGTDCGTPKTEIVKADAVVKDRVFSIPLDFIWNILHARNNFRYFQNGDTYFALQNTGDGACTTDVVWVFDKNGLKQRMLGWSY